MPKKQDDEDLKELIEVISKAIQRAEPLISKYFDYRLPLIKRAQLMNFAIMGIICIGVILLALESKIDGSAATGLIGAIIGYVFGSLYRTRK